MRIENSMHGCDCLLGVNGNPLMLNVMMMMIDGPFEHCLASERESKATAGWPWVGATSAPPC